jgi:hypothetical protein
VPHDAGLNQLPIQDNAVTLAVTVKKHYGEWFPPTPLSLLLSPITSRFTRNLKDVREDTDISDSSFCRSAQVTHLGEWTTSRQELWCFYLYSIVRFSLFALSFPIFYYRSKVNKSLAGSGLIHLRFRRTRISCILLAMT